jgi:transglutaminase-like putative cysteine protease
MKLTAGCNLVFNSKFPTTSIFMLRPRSGLRQFVLSESYQFEPYLQVTEYTDSYGNFCQRVILPEGNLSIKFEVCVVTEDDLEVDYSAAFVPIEDLPNENIRFLLPSRYCQSDLLGNLAFSIIDVNATGYAQVESIRAWIHKNIKYQYDTSNTTTSAIDTVNSKVGVCRDFAHLGIALCRSISIPARIVVGYLYDLKPMDLHAWFEAYIGNKWYIFDATQAIPKGNRIAVAYGFDAADVALSTHFGDTVFETMEVWVK